MLARCARSHWRLVQARPGKCGGSRKASLVILDNLATHKNPEAEKAMRQAGCWFVFLPPYSPDLNPIEMAFSKLKALLRKAAARTVGELWDAIAQSLDAFTPQECENYFAAAGYDRD